ncbi:MAG: hypothetical protein M0C28_39575 [Candidatus Moduliflexus flocculans]|nr:hypothetical protein [Candidatus Moduliflexus flocculans]
MLSRTPSLVRIHLAVVLFGFPGLFGKWLALLPVPIVFGRVSFAAATLALVMAAGRRGSPASGVAGISSGSLVCGLVLAVHWTTFFQSVQVSSVAVDPRLLELSGVHGLPRTAADEGALGPGQPDLCPPVRPWHRPDRSALRSLRRRPPGRPLGPPGRPDVLPS